MYTVILFISDLLVRYGNNFKYKEAMAFKGAAGLFKALFVAFNMIMLPLLLLIAPVRNLFRRVS